jgi:hypothetical protein
MCDACWQYVMGDLPWCSQCGHRDGARTRRVWSFGTLAAAASAILAFFVVRHVPDSASRAVWLGIACGAALAIGLAARRAWPIARDPARLRRRESDDGVDASAPARGPYRATFVRCARIATPNTSGRATATALGIAFLATASLVPAALRLPGWLEVEWVLLAWWAFGAAALATLIYRGARLADDYQLELGQRRAADWLLEPSRCFMGDEGDRSKPSEGFPLWPSLSVAAWVLVEFVGPLIFFFFYAIVLRAARSVLSLHGGCHGRLASSMAWGAIWAAVYALPLSLLVRLAHAVLAGRFV